MVEMIRLAMAILVLWMVVLIAGVVLAIRGEDAATRFLDRLI